MTIPGLEKLCQEFRDAAREVRAADGIEKYAREHFITGDGVPKLEAMERKIKARFLELLEQHPEMTRLQAYTRAQCWQQAKKRRKMTRVALLRSDTMMGPLRAGIIWEDEVKGEKGLTITFPASISREDFDCMKEEIMAALMEAERRGEQKALAKIAAKGGG